MGQNVVEHEEGDKAIKISDTYIANKEEVLLAKGWKPPKKRRRLR